MLSARQLISLRRTLNSYRPLVCPGEAGLASVLTYEKLFENGLPEVENIQPVIKETDKLWTPYVGRILKDAFEKQKLPNGFSEPADE